MFPLNGKMTKNLIHLIEILENLKLLDNLKSFYVSYLIGKTQNNSSSGWILYSKSFSIWNHLKTYILHKDTFMLQFLDVGSACTYQTRPSAWNETECWARRTRNDMDESVRSTTFPLYTTHLMYIASQRFAASPTSKASDDVLWYTHPSIIGEKSGILLK